MHQVDRDMDRPKTGYMVLLGVTVVSLLALGYWYFRVHPQPVGKRTQALMQPDHSVRIEGLSFFSIKDGRKVISLEGASFTIEKKKIGFFRIALAHTARLADGRLVIFVAPDGQRQVQNPLPSGNSSATEYPRHDRQIRFPQLLSDAVLKDFPVPLGRVTSIAVEPISVKIMAGDSLLTSITAAAAEISLKNRDVHFEGNVRVISGNKTLHAGELTFDPSTGSLRTNRDYRMTGGNGITAGKNLRTDIFLQPVSTSR